MINMKAVLVGLAIVVVVNAIAGSIAAVYNDIQLYYRWIGYLYAGVVGILCAVIYDKDRQ